MTPVPFGTDACPATNIIGISMADEPSSIPVAIAKDDERGGRNSAAAKLQQAKSSGAIKLSANHCQASGVLDSMPSPKMITSTPANPKASPRRPRTRKRSIRASIPKRYVSGGDRASTIVCSPAGRCGTA